MNKALHAFVYLFLILAGAALWFELQLNAKRTLLTDRNRIQEKYLIQLARTVEKEEVAKEAAPELLKDDAPVEAKIIDNPDKVNVLENYKSYLEKQNLATFDWNSQATKEQLRMVYVLDGEGNPIMDGAHPLMEGKGTEDELLKTLFDASNAQLANLNNTRAELASLRGILEETVEELNRLKPIARQDKVLLVEKDDKISSLEKDKSGLQNQIVSIKSQIDELNGEITSLKDEVNAKADEIAEKADKLEQSEKMVANLQKIMKDMMAQNAGSSSAAGAVISSVPFGDKGKVVEVDNENMFAIVAFSDEAMKELKGKSLDKPIPNIEFSVKRVSGANEEFVGRVRIRQEISGRNYVICDVLSAWKQSEMRADDVVFAD